MTGGTALDAPGFYLAPTLVELGSPEGPLATEEVFAPVAAVLRADSAEAAVRIANDVRYGLVTALFTQDLGRRCGCRRFDAGMVRVNAPTSGVDFHAPFGGAKQSSYGPREQGTAARGFYTETRTVPIVPCRPVLSRGRAAQRRAPPAGLPGHAPVRPGGLAASLDALRGSESPRGKVMLTIGSLEAPPEVRS